MKLGIFAATAVLMTSVFAQAAQVEIKNAEQVLPAGVAALASQTIAERCPGAIAKSPLKLVDVELKPVKVDQGIIDKVYTLSIQVPNSTNDNDEDGFELVITEASISNPAFNNLSLDSYYAYGWTCR